MEKAQKIENASDKAIDQSIIYRMKRFSGLVEPTDHLMSAMLYAPDTFISKSLKRNFNHTQSWFCVTSTNHSYFINHINKHTPTLKFTPILCSSSS